MGTPPLSPRVIVGMSGGVDSSVAALLLKKQGFAVEGLFMKNWEEDDGTEYCTAKEDLADAQAVADQLGIHLHTANFAAEYWDNVFEHFLSEYKAGRTPNPDILCNKEIKFRAFLDYAMDLGADYIATGHYARTTSMRYQGEDQTCLFKGVDPQKDQSYFLYAVDSAKLEKTLFPLGALHKSQVRQIAEQHQLATSHKKDSTGICFIGERRFRDFLQRYIPAQPGNIETPEGKVVGRHQGLMFHTTGQRQGLGIGGLKDSSDEPWYVAAKDLKQNVLIVVQGKKHPLLYSEALIVKQIDWINASFADSDSLSAKIRYRQQDEPCYIEQHHNDYKVVFKGSQWAITPGQSIVFYKGEQCLGGGIIERAVAFTDNPDKLQPHFKKRTFRL